MEDRHPLSKKANWIKLILGIAIAVCGVLTQFDITVNQSVVATASDPQSYPAVKRSYITEAACRGIEKGDKLDDLRDRFKYDTDNTSALHMPLANDHDLDCTVFDDYDGKADHVSLDLVAF